MMAGSLEEGYMVFPASSDVRAKVTAIAAERGVPVH